MCWTQKLDQTFLAHKAHFSASGNFASDDELPQMYFGDDAVGLFRMLPAVYQDTGGPYGCGAYDPRVRPWYTNAVSPPKDVVILITFAGGGWIFSVLDEHAGCCCRAPPIDALNAAAAFS